MSESRLISGKIILYVSEMNRACKFYEEIIGLDIISRSAWWSELSCRGLNMALHRGGLAEASQTGLNFVVTNVYKAAERVSQGGGKITVGPKERNEEGIVVAYCLDTEGNAFSLTEYRSGAR